MEADDNGAVVTDDGRILSGMIGDESTGSLMLIGSKGEPYRLLRTQIAEISSTGVSLMPEGMEQSISPAQMADLVAFLQQPLAAAAARPLSRE